MSTNKNDPPLTVGRHGYWPRWASIASVVSGLVVIIAETTSYLVFAGLFLVAAGIYGLVTVRSSDRPNALPQ
jgi:hypothetical protein